MPGVWDITDGLEVEKPFVNMFLLEGTEKALLIDAGVSNDDLKGFVRTLTDKPIQLVITHGHGDHTACVNQFDEVYMSGKDVETFASAPEFSEDSFKFTDLKGGELFDLGGCKIEVIAFPGHTPGSLLLLDYGRQLLFASDSMGSGALWMHMPYCSSVEEYVQEIRRIEKLVEGMDALKLYVGHHCLMEPKPDKQYITDTRIAAEGIVSGEITGVKAEDSPEYAGALSASYGQMTNFLYRVEKIHRNTGDYRELF